MPVEFPSSSQFVRSGASPSVAGLGKALRAFKRIDNEQWLIERHGFRAPSQARIARSQEAGTRKPV
jgi:hypothetical protein